MKRLASCRRTFICALGMVLCLIIGLVLKIDTTGAIMWIAIGLAGANGSEGIAQKVGTIFAQKGNT